MRFRLKNINERWKEYALAGSVCIILLVVLLNLGNILQGIGSFFGMMSTIFIGFVIAYILNPLAVLFRKTLFSKIKKEKPAWVISVFLSFIIVLGLLVLLMALLIPQVAENVSGIVENAQELIESVGETGIDLGFLPDSINEALNNYIYGEEGLLSRAGRLIADNIGKVISATSNAGGRAASWAIGIILAIYFLLEKEGIKKALDKLGGLVLAPMRFVRCKILLEKFHGIFSKYIVCEILDALVVGILNGIFMVIAGLPDALFISVIAAVTNLAPNFGPIVGLVINCFFLVLTVPDKLLMFVIFTIILQTIDGYVIKPKLFGGVLNVPGVLILIFIIVFSELMGVGGILLSIPFAGIALYLYNEALIPWLELRRDLKKYKEESSKEN